MRLPPTTLRLRLLVVLGTIAVVSTGLALQIQDRALVRDLERAAEARLGTSAEAVEWLAARHLAAVSERYRALTSSPQVRALLELEHAPTVVDFAERWLQREDAARIALLAADGSLIAGAGDASLDLAAREVGASGLVAHDGVVYAAARIPLEAGGRTLGDVMAVERLPDQVLAEWSKLAAAHVHLIPSGEPVSPLDRTVRDLGTATLRVASSFEAERAALSRSRRNLLVAGSIGLGAALLAGILLSNGLLRPIQELRQAAQRVGEGDLRIRVDTDRRDEIGDVSRAFVQMAERLRETLSGVTQAADGVEQTAEEIASVSSQVAQVTASQLQGVRSAGARIDDVTKQMEIVSAAAAESATILEGAIDGSSSSFRELRSNGAELNQSASELCQGVDGVVGGVENVTLHSRRMVEHTEHLTSAAAETAERMRLVAEATRRVTADAQQGARLSKGVVDAAERGAIKVGGTMEGMRAIGEATEEALLAIRSLGGRVVEIEKILGLIDAVTGQTDLLALNASIIAARAGEHGKAFGVVSEEMKKLAERVGAGTKEIGALIAAVQNESGNALSAIERGAVSVRSGVALAGAGSESLEDIGHAARECVGRMNDIVAAMEQQIGTSGEVVRLMQGVNVGVEEVRAAGREQVMSHDGVLEMSRAIGKSAETVRRTTEQQGEGAKRIEATIDLARDAVTEMRESLLKQSQGFRESARELEQVGEQTGANEESVERMAGAMHMLRRQAERLREAARRFQV